MATIFGLNLNLAIACLISRSISLSFFISSGDEPRDQESGSDNGGYAGSKGDNDGHLLEIELPVDDNPGRLLEVGSQVGDNPGRLLEVEKSVCGVD